MAANIVLLSPIEDCLQIVENSSGGVTKGAFRTIGSVNCFAFTSAEAGDEFEYSTDNPSNEDPEVVYIYFAPRIRVNKISSAIAIGAKLYYDEANDHVTTEQTGNNLIGFALESATASATTIMCEFDGRLENLGGLA